MSNVKDVKRKQVTLDLGDGKQRSLKLTLNAMAELEDRYGSVDKAFEKLEEGSIKAVRCVLWACLQHNEEKLTEEQVGEMIDVDNMEEIMKSLNRVVDQDSAEPTVSKGKVTVINGADPN